MNTAVNKNGDDEYFNRLLSYFQSNFYENIIQMIPFRKNVLFIKTEKNIYIVKGYHSNHKLKLQESFSATLRKEGFSRGAVFVYPSVKEPLYFEGLYFGTIKYIEPNKRTFSFQTEKNRQEAIELIEQFHSITGLFETRYRSLLPKNRLIDKWKERATIFSKNVSFVRYFINEPFLADLLEWANWSLSGMTKHRLFFLNEPFVVLHGDVAHHNFLRDTKGKLHLIDFDLISIGSKSLDYLQYANRILPFLDWSMKQLADIPTYTKLLHEKAFLYALAFPADIFREWNRLIREKTYSDQVKLKQVMDLTIGQIYLRKKHIDDLRNMVK